MMKLTFKKIVTIASLISLSACTNMASLKNRATNTLTNPSYSSSSSSYTHSVQNASVVALTTGSPPDLKLSLSVATGSLSLTQYCSTGSSGANPCSCELTWTETNTVGGVAVSVNRTKKLSVIEVQAALVKCQMTAAFWNEVPTGTTMRMNIIAVTPNTSGLQVQSVGYKKGTSIAPAGDFVDDTLTPFRNIYRYTCFSKRLSSHEVVNAYSEASITSGSTTQQVNVLIASTFCGDSGSGCSTPRNGYSTQSYYRNLFIRSDKLGEINSTNARYDCPKVFESITNSATDPVTVPAAEQSKYWPLDTTFAVATTSSSEWNVQIPAASVLMKNGDTTAVDDAGIAAKDRLKELGGSTSGSNAGIAWKIMGYGKKPNADGTCGSIVDSNGRSRPLTRLRRYRVIYPTTYENSGQVAQERIEADQVYVADRLVVDVAGNLNGNMIYGPKPCNFSWYDHEGVTNRTTTSAHNFQTNFTGSTVGSSSWPTYRSTSNFYYNNGTADTIVSPDGRVLPNIDRDGAIGGISPPACSAAITVYDELMGVPVKGRLLTSYFNRTDKVTLGSRDFYLNEIHINPVERWSPDYVEDTSFKACVPISDPYLEPPLHFYKKSTTEVAWCAKVYPTQNPYWLDVNARKKPLAATISAKAMNWGNVGINTNTALVKWYTSHVATGAGLDAFNTTPACTGTSASKVCEFSLGTTAGVDYTTCQSYLGNLIGGNTARCDRTVMFDANQEYRGFPLLAEDDDITDMLSSDLTKDKSYSCTFSVHSNPNKINKNQPLSNCCGVISGTPLLDNGNFSMIPSPANEGHLEPHYNNAFPTIRFCGNPVE